MRREALHASEYLLTSLISRPHYCTTTQLHPDRDPSNPALHSQFVELNEAYRVLSKDLSRKDYDLKIRHPYSGNQAFRSTSSYTNYRERWRHTRSVRLCSYPPEFTVWVQPDAQASKCCCQGCVSCSSLKLAPWTFHFEPCLAGVTALPLFSPPTPLPPAWTTHVTGSSFISLVHRTRWQRTGRVGEGGTFASWATVSSPCCSASEPMYSSSGEKIVTILTVWLCVLYFSFV